MSRNAARFGLPLLLAAVLAGCESEAAPSAAVPPEAQAAVFAGGCFWCTEADFDKMPGVLSTTSGYTGGRVRNPTYQQVVQGNTGHIEAVRVVYDPRRTNYAQLARGSCGQSIRWMPAAASATGATAIARPFSLARSSSGASLRR
jgi:peptide-methionine (S)-S-oxide reductase